MTDGLLDNNGDLRLLGDEDQINFLPDDDEEQRDAERLARVLAYRSRFFNCGVWNRLQKCLFAALIITCIILFILVIYLAGKKSSVEKLQHSDRGSSTKEKKQVLDTNGKPFPWQSIRLPSKIIPLNYDLFLHPNLTTFLFAGVVNVTVQNSASAPHSSLILHSKSLKITDYRISSCTSHEKIGIEKFLEQRTPHNHLYFGFTRPIKQKETCVLHIKFSGVINESLDGFYRSSYKMPNGEKRWLATTQFEPIAARQAFPCFDEPAFKATFKLSVVREKRHNVRSNMPIEKTEQYNASPELEIDRFQKSVKMSTYLVAYVISDFQGVTNYLDKKNKKSTQVGVWAGQHIKKDYLRFALDTALAIMPYFEQLFGEKFPLPKQDMFAIPDFSAGAMENWGLITYRETALLNTATSSASERQRIASVISHELAHQWFGNLVTMKWWSDLWLNEGFASYVEYLGVEHAHPKFKFTDQFYVNDLRRALNADSFLNSHAIFAQVKTAAAALSRFDTITYNKGSSVLRMLGESMGRENFRKGLIKYIARYKYSNAATNDLWEALNEAASFSVPKLMDTWTLQMGFPLVTVTKDAQSKQYHLTQTRFLVNPNKTGILLLEPNVTTKFNYLWNFNISFVESVDPAVVKSQYVSSQSKVTFPSSGDSDWFKFNHQHFILCRVNYDTENWKTLTKQLTDDHTVFSPVDRAGLLDDSFFVAAAGHTDISVWLDMLNYLSKEDNYVPWKVVHMNVGSVTHHLVLFQEAQSMWKKFVLTKLYRPLFQRLSSQKDLKTDHLKILLHRSLMNELVYFGEKSDVEKDLLVPFQNWLLDENAPLDKALRGAIFQAGVKHGNDSVWETVLGRYMKSVSALERVHLLIALSYTKNIQLIQRLLSFSLNATVVRSQHVSTVLYIVAGQDNYVDLVFQFVKRYWKALAARLGGVISGGKKLVGFLNAFSTESDLRDAKRFFFNNPDVGPIELIKRPLYTALERIQYNIHFVKTHKDPILKWLNNHG